jgi:hypothetical protein
MKKAILGIVLVALMFVAGCKASGAVSVDDPKYHQDSQSTQASK